MSRSLVAALLAMTLVGGARADGETFAGLPRGPDVRVLHNPGFVVGYSEQRRQPLWVAYRASSLEGTPRIGPRPKHFSVDARTRARVSSLDYTGSRYTRGHLAPNYLIGKLYGQDAQRATFLMSNIAPQKARLNQLVWERLETAEADVVAPRAGELWVVTGPVFDPQPERLKAGIAVPRAFYRVWLDVRDGGAPAALGFVVPQGVCGTEPLAQFLASVDDIERDTGIDFFHELADATEAVLERGRATAGWGLWRYNQRAPRYGDKFDLEICDT